MSCDSEKMEVIVSKPSIFLHGQITKYDGIRVSLTIEQAEEMCKVLKKGIKEYYEVFR